MSSRTPAPTLAAPRTPLILRAMAALLLAKTDRSYAVDVAKERWPAYAKEIERVCRAAVSPASSTQAGWAAELAGNLNADVISALSPFSAFAQVRSLGVRLQFGETNSITVPTILSSGSDVTFVAQGQPISVKQFSISGPQLSPRKLGIIVGFTAEITKYSTPSIEALMRVSLEEAIKCQLDAVAFGTAVGDGTKPPGLLAGISPLTVSNDPDIRSAMDADIGTLAAAVAGVANGSPIAFIASPKQHARLVLWGGGDFLYPAFASSALADHVVIALATNGIASAVDPAVRFSVDDQTTLHMNDVPSQIGTAGTPNVIAAPTRNLWQTDSLALRVIFECGWVLRHSSAIAFMNDTSW